MKIDDNTIIPLMTLDDLVQPLNGIPYAVCTDHPSAV
jgi:hypothetical protein